MASREASVKDVSPLLEELRKPGKSWSAREVCWRPCRPSQKCEGTGIFAKRRFSQGALRGTGEGPHLGKEQLTGQPFTHVSSCGHQPVGEPDPEGSKEPDDLKIMRKCINSRTDSV